MKKNAEKILILAIDFLTINLSGVIYFMLRVKTGWFKMLIMPELFVPILIIYFYWVLIFTFVGMYRTWFAASRFDEISTLFKASFVGIFILFFAIFLDDYLHGVQTGTRILIFFYWGIFLILVGAGRIFIRSFQRNLLIKGFGRRNALIVGFNSKGKEVHDQMIEHRALGIDVKGYVSLKKNSEENSYKNISILGSVNEIQSLIDQTNAKEVILALERDDHDMLVEVISKCEPKNVGLKIVPDLYDILSGQARTAQIYGVPLIDIMPQLMPEWEKRLKRILDIVVSMLILIIGLPIMAIASLAIKLDSKGPVFFRQERCGLNNKIFRIIKFRSMQHDAEKMTGPVWSQKDDPRITRVGNIIRKLRIDEIPQMINVLRGEMSLVGPRPERPFFVEKLSEQIPYYKRRLKVRPGITGWAQVKHKYDESIEDVKIKLRYDLFYIENMSLRMDFKILFRTVFVVIFARGHYN
jgi:exopolysaccharide biosynthesis polyprenyl glycosylphosphotransferase